MCKHFCLPLQVDFGIDVGCVDGNMAQPCADGVDIDSGAKKVKELARKAANKRWENARAKKKQATDKGTSVKKKSSP
jgi:hypothetical protein